VFGADGEPRHAVAVPSVDEPLAFDPVNAWTGTLLLAIALDLSAAHARGRTAS
jgi:hypothetical protein